MSVGVLEQSDGEDFLFYFIFLCCVKALRAVAVFSKKVFFLI